MIGAYLRGLVPIGLLLGVALAVVQAPRPAEPSSGPAVYRHALGAVAWVRSTDKGQGSGWVVDRRRRWLVTCYHVVGDNDTVEVVFPVRRGDGSNHRGTLSRSHSTCHATIRPIMARTASPYWRASFQNLGEILISAPCVPHKLCCGSSAHAP